MKNIIFTTLKLPFISVLLLLLLPLILSRKLQQRSFDKNQSLLVKEYNRNFCSLSNDNLEWVFKTCSFYGLNTTDFLVYCGTLKQIENQGFYYKHDLNVAHGIPWTDWALFLKSKYKIKQK